LKMSEIEPGHGRTSHDRLFKEFLHRFLPQFLQLFFPDEAARLDFATLTFLEQELMINLPDQTLRITDVVAEVATLGGEPKVILVHVEVEAREKQSLPARMFEYYALLRLLKHRLVLPIALVLLPNAGGLEWQGYEEQLFGHQLLDFRYAQVGLRDLPGEQYLTGYPVAATLAALMKAEREHPAVIKLAGLRTVIESDLTTGDKLFLIDVIEKYLPTERLLDAGAEIMESLAETELLWSERITLKGLVKGREEGRIEGRIDLLLHQLTVKFGRLPDEMVQAIEAIKDTAVLDQLSEQVLTAQTLADLHLPEGEQ
jgi:hypothetical protein